MNEPKLKTSAQERNRCANSVCPSVITVRRMADDIKTLLAERDALAEKLRAEQERVADEEGDHYFSPDGMIAHEAKIRRKALEEAASHIEKPNNRFSQMYAEAIRALIDAPKEEK